MKKIFLSVVLIMLSGCSVRSQQEMQSPEPTALEPVAVTATAEPSTATSLPTTTPEPKLEVNYINPEGETVKERFLLPEGFKRIEQPEGSFGHYLQNLSLKPDGAAVKYFDGREKSRSVYLAVADFDLGERDLQQCADSLIRLRAEYFYSLGKYENIKFNFTNGFPAEFSRWAKGNRIVVEGNNVYWSANGGNNDSYESLQKFLDMVYAYAGTISLEKEMVLRDTSDMQIGDTFIKGGSPGHCVMVVDMAENEVGEMVFMLVQGYMPAQDIQVLKNPAQDNSPWYSRSELTETQVLTTPEWRFSIDQLRCWN